jgi:hypothetical protein
MPNEKPTVNFTAEDLQNIIATAIAAAKEPTEIEKITLDEKRAEQEARRAQIEADQQMRADTARQQIVIMQNKRAAQHVCTHKHRKSGDTHCVFVSDDLGGYVLCQKCQAVIRPGAEPAKNNAGVIYDTALFNQLFQECSDNGLWG